MTKDLTQLVGRRVLVTVGLNDAPRETAVDMISPNGRYVRLLSGACTAESIGWVPLVDVVLLDVLGFDSPVRSL